MKGYTGFIKTAYLKNAVKYRTKDFFDKKNVQGGIRDSFAHSRPQGAALRKVLSLKYTEILQNYISCTIKKVREFSSLTVSYLIK